MFETSPLYHFMHKNFFLGKGNLLKLNLFKIGDDHSLVDTKENELLHPITVNGLKNENQKQALRFPQVKNTGTHGSFNEKVLIAGPFISGRIEPTQRKFHWVSILILWIY